MPNGSNEKNKYARAYLLPYSPFWKFWQKNRCLRDGRFLPRGMQYDEDTNTFFTEENRGIQEPGLYGIRAFYSSYGIFPHGNQVIAEQFTLEVKDLDDISEELLDSYGTSELSI